MLRQPRSVWAVAFTCVIAFMGIGLVDPILKPIADDLGASPAEMALLFSGYIAVMGVAMLFTGAVSSRLGVKRTLLTGLAVIVVGAGMAGLQDSVGAIVVFRGVWGLGNALVIATALAAIVTFANGSSRQSIILFESALGIGIATGPLLGGWLGSMSWRAPFLGVAALMSIAFVVTAVALPRTSQDRSPGSVVAALGALRRPGLLIVALSALLYTVGFFTLLAFTPFPLDLTAHQIGLVFCGWGALLAVTSVLLAPLLQRRFGTARSIAGALGLFAATLATMAVLADSKPALIACVIVSGGLMGVCNTLITDAAMGAVEVERQVSSSAYSFVRFAGGAGAPWLAGLLGERMGIAAPFWLAAMAVAVGSVIIFIAGRTVLAHLDTEPQLA